MDAQEDELVALEAILDPSEITISPDRKHGVIRVSADTADITEPFKLRIHSSECSSLDTKASETILVSFLPPVRLEFNLTDEYPARSRPNYSLSCAWIPQRLYSNLEEALENVWKANQGTVILFLWYTTIKDILSEFMVNTREIFIDSEELISEMVRYNEMIRFNKWHECTICLSSSKGTDFVTLSDCRHGFCKSCLSRYCSEKLGSDFTSCLNCPDPECGQPLPIVIIQSLVDPELFGKYDTRLLNIALRSMPDTAWCPVLSCQHPAQIFDALGLCPACKFAFCSNCLKTYHGPDITECSPREPKQDPIVTEKSQSKDALEFQKIILKHGTKKAKMHADRLIDQIFSGLDKRERFQLARDYINGDEATRKELDAIYGRAFMIYFTSAKTNNITPFTLLLTNVGDESTDEDLRSVMDTLCFISKHHNMKACPNCFIPIEKKGGCHHMYCTFCSTHFCWDCLNRMKNCVC